MNTLYLDILRLVYRGDHPIRIALMLDIPIAWVYEAMELSDTDGELSPYETINS